MASLKRRPGSPFWIACYARANGERAQVSTKQRSRDDALKVLVSLVNAEEHARRGTMTEAHAWRIISEIVERTSGEPLAFYTVADWLREWLSGKEQTKAKGTHVRYSKVVGDFVAHLGKRAELNLQHITPKDIREFRDKEREKGKSGKTCNLAIKTLVGAFNSAVRQGYITSNPARALEALKHKAAERGSFSPAHVEDLLKVATSKICMERFSLATTPEPDFKTWQT